MIESVRLRRQLALIVHRVYDSRKRGDRVGLIRAKKQLEQAKLEFATFKACGGKTSSKPKEPSSTE